MSNPRDIKLCKLCGDYLRCDGSDALHVKIAATLGVVLDDLECLLGREMVVRYWCEKCGPEKTELVEPLYLSSEQDY